MNVLAQLLCSRVRAEVFRVLFGLKGGELHLREIQRQTHLAVGTVRQDIEKLVKMGLVSRRTKSLEREVLDWLKAGHPELAP
jgi:DNA-binding MarR family transcriptional regulator